LNGGFAARCAERLGLSGVSLKIISEAPPRSGGRDCPRSRQAIEIYAAAAIHLNGGFAARCAERLGLSAVSLKIISEAPPRSDGRDVRAPSNASHESRAGASLISRGAPASPKY